MWIEGIELERFLVFEDREVRFDPGLNVVVAPNEGGKSSLFRGILTALYGDASSRKRGIRELQRWGSSSMFRVAMNLHLGSDHLSIERDFEKKRQAVYRVGEDDPLAKDRSVDAYLRENLTLPDEELFVRLCGVRQEELDAVSEAKGGLGERLEEILGGGWGEATPQSVKKALDEKKAELRRGLDHPARPENYGPLRRLQDEIARLEMELHEAERIAGAREELLGSISEAEKELGERTEAFEMRKTRMDRAIAFRDCSKREEQARERADSKRKKKERITSLLEKQQEIEGKLTVYPRSLVNGDKAQFERYRDGLREEERLAGTLRAATERKVKPVDWLKVAGGAVCILIGVLGTVYLRREFLVIAIMGALLLVWEVLQRLRGGKKAEIDAERARLSQLVEDRRDWAGERSVEESRELLDQVCQLKDNLETVLVRLGEATGAGERDAEYSRVLADLEKEYSAAALEWKALDGERKELESFRLDPDELLRLEGEIKKADLELQQLRDSFEERKREIAILDRKDTSGILEHLSACRSDLERTNWKAEVIEIALVGLENARRGMAGFLSTKLPPRVGEIISGITEGRYGSVTIDPMSLEVATVPAEGDISASARDETVPERISPHILSQGARDQLYLALRLALVELLSAREPQPLFLDDPFVHFDAARKERALMIVKEFAGRHQVILFTCDSSYGGLGGRLIRL